MPKSSEKFGNVSFGKHHKIHSENGWQKRGNPSPKSKKSNSASEFPYGNYHQYYGYRNQGSPDPRLLCMKQEWFAGKDVLDIGCNAGHLTLALAQRFAPRSMVGVDIDHTLVKAARSNVRHYISWDDYSGEFPLNLSLIYGPVALTLDPRGRYPDAKFPFNVQFIQCNYVFPCDDLLEWQEACFDTVLCFSLTKWIHLNWGDVGIHRLFHRIHSHLRPGGFLLLEAQAFQSYARKKKIAPDALKHYNEIELFPEMFNEYLLQEIGFESCELVDTPAHSSKGFSRPIYLFTKGRNSSSVWQPKNTVYYESSESPGEYSDAEQLSE